jgi:hypothetical protein
MTLKCSLLSLIALATVACAAPAPTSPSVSGAAGAQALRTGGFDQYGYNRTARIFNGTGSSWSLEKGLPADYLGIYAPDKLVMKWNAEWDRGNAEGWTDPNGYDAWENNEWNGKCAGCSGEVWHYKIKWIGACGADGTLLSDGGYCIWGVFDVIMDQGQDPNVGPGHLWFAHAKPNGYGG